MTEAPGTADYVVVGAGSAGCMLANRLSEDGSMPSANTNAATYMIAEKASDMIREDARR